MNEKIVQEIEMTQLDLRYESCRMRHPQFEGRLLSSIAERGIEEALEVVVAGAAGAAGESSEPGVLINGFKRYRCARKLQLATVPFISLGGDEAVAIMNLLRAPKNKALSILEQARFIDELCKVRGMGLAEIAAELSRSKAWVSMRLGLIEKLSPAVSKELFSGRFPVYSYIYTLLPFMRMNSVKREEVDRFVTVVSAKNLSIREIEQLAHGFFRGPESFRREILEGNLTLSLEQIRELAPDPGGCSEFERVLLGDLELMQKYMERIMGKSHDPRIKSRAFHAQAHLLTAGILSRCPTFTRSLKHLHDRSGQA